MKAGIALEAWKVPTFTQVIEAAGFKVVYPPDQTGDVHVLTVECDSAIKLAPAVKLAVARCEALRAPKGRA